MVIKNKKSRVFYTIILYMGLIFCAGITLFIVNHNERFYHRTIGKVVELKEDQGDLVSEHERIYHQKLKVRIQNGKWIGEIIGIENQYSTTRAYDFRFRVGDKLFLSLNSTDSNTFSPSITGVKRDFYFVMTAWVFFIFLIVIGKRRGFFSALSLFGNITILYFALDLYRRGMNLVLLCALLSILFTVISMGMVLGKSKKAYAAILTTVIATFFTMVITYVVMIATKKNGMRFEEMQFITRPIGPIFMSEILLGSLGAIMDIAITITSSMFELHPNNMGNQALIDSGKEIGRDIMGSMCNVLLLAYVSGSIPIILLYIKNGMPVFNAFYTNLSLELVRALTGSIGIVLSIPISIYVSIYFLNKKSKEQL